MRKANISQLTEVESSSPSGKFRAFDRQITGTLGGDSRSMDLTKRWPFDVELTRIPPGAANYPYHAHSTQYEFYLMVSGTAIIRHQDGETEVGPGDFFIFGPTEPHQIINRSAADVVYYSVADNPINEHAYYPDSDKYLLRMPEKRLLIKGGACVDYFHGEDDVK